MNTTSDTPRTDAAEYDTVNGVKVTPYVDSEVARGLERELNAAARVIVEQSELTQAVWQFQKEVWQWSRDTFPLQTPASKASHLHDEAGELMEMPGDPEEMADVFLLLVQLAEMHGYDLMKEARKKFEINKARKWGEADARGVVKHVEP